MVVRIYFEGKHDLREGFAEFFTEIRDLARSRRGKVDFISARDRASAVKDFMTALKKNPDAYTVLLIDCEGPASGCSLSKLQQEYRSIWATPPGISVDSSRVFRMTQIMESWFLADRETLSSYYGRRFQDGALPGHPKNVEEVPKRDVLDALAKATRGTSKKGYRKGSHAKEILRRIDPGLVREGSPECDRIFTTLTRVIASA